MKVIKFGGSSLSSSKNILKVLRIVESYKKETIIILSAFGKTTNNIISCGQLASNKKTKYKELFQEIESYHYNIIRDLVDINYQVKILTEVQKKFLELENILDGIYITIIGGLGMVVPSQGGIGSYHLAVKLVLNGIGIAMQPALLFAFAVHTAQTLMTIIFGLFSSFILLSTKKNVETTK